MGSRGPVPKRRAHRRRGQGDTPVTTAPGAPDVEVPKANSRWHPVAKRWYEALAESGQSAFYQPSDWAVAHFLAEAMSRELRRDGSVRVSAMRAFLAGSSSLLVTEGDRRRVRMELEPPAPVVDGEGAEVAWLDQARRRHRYQEDSRGH